jgi:hypothetical protein
MVARRELNALAAIVSELWQPELTQPLNERTAVV